MTASNTTRAYGWAARAFHWTVAVLILTALVAYLQSLGTLTRTPNAELKDDNQ